MKLFKEYVSNIEWDIENATNINITNENRSGGSNWDAFLYSKTPIYRQDDHYQCVKFQASSTSAYNIVGFGYQSSEKNVLAYDASYFIHFGLYVHPTNHGYTVRIWEGSVDGTAAGVNEDGTTSFAPKNFTPSEIGYSTDDWFEVRVIGTKIEYLYDDDVIFTSPHEAVFPLFIEVVPRSTGGPKNVQFYKRKRVNTLSYGLTNSF